MSSSQSLREQAAQVARCDVAVGVHGTQLMNAMWMEPGSALVELLVQRPRAKLTDGTLGVTLEENAYYRNIAQLSGHSYFSRRCCTTPHMECVERAGLRQKAWRQPARQTSAATGILKICGCAKPAGHEAHGGPAVFRALA